MRKWVKVAVLLTVATAPIAIGAYIYFGMSEESFKILVYTVLAILFGILWHLPELKAGLLV